MFTSGYVTACQRPGGGAPSPSHHGSGDRRALAGGARRDARAGSRPGSTGELTEPVFSGRLPARALRWPPDARCWTRHRQLLKEGAAGGLLRWRVVAQSGLAPARHAPGGSVAARSGASAASGGRRARLRPTARRAARRWSCRRSRRSRRPVPGGAGPAPSRCGHFLVAVGVLGVAIEFMQGSGCHPGSEPKRPSRSLVRPLSRRTDRVSSIAHRCVP